MKASKPSTTSGVRRRDNFPYEEPPNGPRYFRMKLRFKPDTVVRVLDPALLPGLVQLAMFIQEETGAEEVVVTSVNDGVHKSGSLHYEGRAMDLRCRYFAPPQVQAIVDRFKALYDRDYDLLWEKRGTPLEHLHLELDPGNQNR